MVGSNSVSGLGRVAQCETLESRNLFASAGTDAAFGGGLVKTDFGGDDGAVDVIVLKDGRILALGSTTDARGDYKPALAMYNKNGTLSKTFDKDGKLTLGIPDNELDELLQAQDGGILLLGNTKILKLKLDGSVDKSFGKSGYVARPAGGSNNGQARDIELLSDGTLRDVSADGNGVLRIQEVNTKGQVTKSLRRTAGIGADAHVDLDSTGITVMDNLYADQTNVYRFKFDLSKLSTFAKGGVLNLDASFKSYAASHGPWHYPYDDEPVPGTPYYYVDSIVSNPKTGIVITGRSTLLSDKANYVYPDGEGEPYTPLSFAISADGKKVTVDSGRVSGKLLASTDYRPYGASGADGSDFGGTFTKTDGTTRYFSAQPANGPYAEFAQTYGFAAAGDGSYYVAGEIVTVDEATGEYERAFAIAKTVKI